MHGQLLDSEDLWNSVFCETKPGAKVWLHWLRACPTQSLGFILNASQTSTIFHKAGQCWRATLMTNGGFLKPEMAEDSFSCLSLPLLLQETVKASKDHKYLS